MGTQHILSYSRNSTHSLTRRFHTWTLPALLHHKWKSRQCTYWRNIVTRSRNYSCSGKPISITYSETVFVALHIQHAKPMRPFIYCLALKYLSTLSHKRHDYRKKKLLNTKCVFWFSIQLWSEAFLCLGIIQRDVYHNVQRSSCKVLVIFDRF